MLGFLVQKVFAQADCTPGAGGIDLGTCLRLSDSTPVSDVYNNPAFLVNLIVRNVFVLAGVVLFGLVILAGFKFLVQEKKGAEEAKSILTTAILGFVIMFSAYWIVQLIALVTGADIML